MRYTALVRQQSSRGAGREGYAEAARGNQGNREEDRAKGCRGFDRCGVDCAARGSESDGRERNGGMNMIRAKGWSRISLYSSLKL